MVPEQSGDQCRFAAAEKTGGDHHIGKSRGPGHRLPPRIDLQRAFTSQIGILAQRKREHTIGSAYLRQQRLFPSRDK
jgi:hypothetical protein